MNFRLFKRSQQAPAADMKPVDVPEQPEMPERAATEEWRPVATFMNACRQSFWRDDLTETQTF